MAGKRRRPADERTITTPIPRKSQRADSAAAGQAGDLQGLSDLEEADSESVSELLEEGQFFEAEVISGVEDAPPADAGPVRVRKRPEDDLPPEYTDTDPDEPKE